MREINNLLIIEEGDVIDTTDPGFGSIIPDSQLPDIITVNPKVNPYIPVVNTMTDTFTPTDPGDDPEHDPLGAGRVVLPREKEPETPEMSSKFQGYKVNYWYLLLAAFAVVVLIKILKK